MFQVSIYWRWFSSTFALENANRFFRWIRYRATNTRQVGAVRVQDHPECFVVLQELTVIEFEYVGVGM